jgi:hypothetical protein
VKQRMVPMLLIFAAIVALVLNAQGKLIGAGRPTIVSVLFSPDSYDVPTVARFGTFALAFFAYILTVSALNDREAEWLTAVLVIGALAWNQHTHPNGGGVIDTVFGSASGDSSNPISQLGNELSKKLGLPQGAPATKG